MKNEYVLTEKEIKMEKLYQRMQNDLLSYKKEIEKLYDEEDESLIMNLAHLDKRIDLILESLEIESDVLHRENKDYLFRFIVEFSPEISDEEKKELKELAATVFHNIYGKAEDLRTDIDGCLFESDCEELMKASIGTLQDLFAFPDFCDVCKYEDEEFQDNNCDLINEYFFHDESDEPISFLD